MIRIDNHVDDEGITGLIESADKVGLDAPMGWPIAFVEAVHAYSSDGSWPSDYVHADSTVAMRLRRTDVWVWKELAMPPPLSVSTDRIALPAMRAAALLARLPDRIMPDGSGAVVEAYPAAALRRWAFRSRSYKGPRNRRHLRQLLAEFLERTSPWLVMGQGEVERCGEDDNAFDALVAAMVARAAAVGEIEPVPDGDRPVARREGWIAVPVVGSLPRLATGSRP